MDPAKARRCNAVRPGCRVAVRNSRPEALRYIIHDLPDRCHL